MIKKIDRLLTIQPKIDLSKRVKFDLIPKKINQKINTKYSKFVRQFRMASKIVIKEDKKFLKLLAKY